MVKTADSTDDEAVPADVLRVAVISDLHAFDKSLLDGSIPSFFDVSSMTRDPVREPSTGLLQLVAEQSLRADLLLVGGDLTNKAHPSALRQAWEWINLCANRLGNAIVAATPGNHDVDSRHIYNGYDARGVLLQLRPLFPLPGADDAVNDRFWARNFVIHSSATYRLLLLNSAAFHGGNAEEIRHGRISDHTITEIRGQLEAVASRHVNILLCHHHPKHHHELATVEDYEHMKNGDHLLELLSNGRYGDWIVVHGHRHFPKLAYAGGNTSPLIFSAGSLAAVPYPEIIGRARNQFYLMEIDLRYGGGLRGRILAWDWALGHGWQRASRRGSGLPGFSGFGWRGVMGELADRVAASITAPFIPWRDLTNLHPELLYMLPSDLDALSARLHRDFTIDIVFGEDGVPIHLGKTVP